MFVATPFGKMNAECVKKVAFFYNNYGADTPATAKELGVSPAFMTSLVDRGYARVVGKKDTGFYPVGDGLYRKSEANLYVLTSPVAVLWKRYENSVVSLAMGDKYRAQKALKQAEYLFDEGQRKLDSIKGVDFPYFI